MSSQTDENKVDVEEEKRKEELGGNRESAVNREGIERANKESSEVEDSQGSMPHFFVQPEERQRIEVDVLFNKKTGRVVSVSRSGIGVDFSNLKALGHSKVWFDFSQPTYQDMSEHRQRCSYYRGDVKKTIIDSSRLRDCFLIWHLKDWNLTDVNGNKVEIGCDEQGRLTDESLEKVNNVNTSIIDVVMTIFEGDVLVI